MQTKKEHFMQKADSQRKKNLNTNINNCAKN